jgi:argonaute-like protein implicated in RNA metabolism and viral defense
LRSQLHADVVIGVDVKNNTAGFVIVSKNGARIRFKPLTSKQKEKLTEKQIRKYLIELIVEEARSAREPIRTIVIHRDGIVFDEEAAGAKQAIKELKDRGVIAGDADLTILAIAKSSPVSFRLFEIIQPGGGREKVINPEVGYYYILSEREGYVCCTGRSFPRSGSVIPLHVARVDGSMSLEDCLEDVYYLSALAWTRPEDCTRYPVTIKLNDRFLTEEASEYDQDLLEQYDPEEEEAIA